MQRGSGINLFKSLQYLMCIQAFGYYSQLSLEECSIFENVLYSNYEDEKRLLAIKLACYTETLSAVVRKCEGALLRRKRHGTTLRVPLAVYRQMDTFGDHYYFFR